MLTPEELVPKAKEKHQEHLLQLKQLKRRVPKHLDRTMSTLHDEVFSEMDCLICANCCKTTSPILTNKDIERLSKHFRLTPGKFIDKYVQIDGDQDYVFQGIPCPFLDETDNYCLVYDQRPKACREFPHTNRKKFYQINDLTIQNVKICPAVYEVLERLAISSKSFIKLKAIDN